MKAREGWLEMSSWRTGIVLVKAEAFEPYGVIV